MAGFFYLCYTGSVHKIGEEVKLVNYRDDERRGLDVGVTPATLP